MGNVLIHHGPFFFFVHLVRHAKRSHCFDQRSVGISDRSVARYLRSERESSERSWALPAGSKASFPFRSRASEMLAKWPIDERALAHLCSTNAKSFASPPYTAARLDGLANLRFGDRTTEPEIKRRGPTKVRA